MGLCLAMAMVSKHINLFATLDAASDTNCASADCLVRDFGAPSADRQHEAGRQYAAGQSPGFEEK